MKISKIEIQNFRSIKDETIDCENYNCFVGPNGSGKSTVLNALNVFFGEISTFSDDDFFNREANGCSISIKVTFSELSEKAADEFTHYVRNGRLVVRMLISKSANGSFTKSVRGERLVFEPFRVFFERKNAKEGAEIFKSLKAEYEGIASATNEASREQALNDYEETLTEDKKTLIESGDEFFGASKGGYKIQRHVQWVYIPAVKDASSESEEAKTSHLGKLIQHTIRAQMNYGDKLDEIRDQALRAYDDLLSGQLTHLRELQDRLAERLQNAVTTDAGLTLDWKKNEKSVAVSDPTARVLLSDKGFSGEVESFGHGLQRSFLIVILQELMAVDSEVNPTLILGCEEPELYQHPPQAKHLASILTELAEAEAQIFATTHSPYFIDVDHYSGIKMFRNVDGAVSVSKSSFETILSGYNSVFDRPLQNENQARTKLAIQTQPKFNEVFFADKVVLIEGISDQACIETYLRLSGKRRNFQRSGASLIVCDGKSSLALMLLIAKDFNIPFHVIFDCDCACRPQDQTMHVRDNDAIFQLAGLPALGALPNQHVFNGNISAWKDTIEGLLDEEFADESEQFKQAGRDAVGNLRSSQKNPIFVAAMMMAAWQTGRRFPILESVIEASLSPDGHS